MTLLKDILFLLGVVCIAFLKSWIIGVSLIFMLTSEILLIQRKTIKRKINITISETPIIHDFINAIHTTPKRNKISFNKVIRNTK